ncbi:flagella synthesis protein FlgN [Simiduia aestuariiviva]|uniref:Flagella synthesis protein FlgN n=1 Tax=Simiduia aestuariiviva TaxID=1510459 RepID=A0A839USV5_9GAMM|nr:flagellar protein FlgN [Simiduia aestuariiviva]MBB3168455.1 flagella synthesis protein FlgN [Simiduia aestuariiviva]
MATPLPFQIAKIIDQECRAASNLLQLLKRESVALSQRNIDELANIIEQKSQELVTLDQAGKQRHALLTQQKLPADDKHWRLLLSRCRDEKLLQLWQSLEQNIKRCKMENETNGKLLARSQRVLDRLTAVLKGQSADTSLYNQKGNHNAGKRTLTYAQA